MQKEEQKLADEIVISDTCCLISFEKINRLYLLSNLYKKVYITPDVLDEYEKGGSKIPSFIEIKEVKNKDEINNFLSIGLHLGEASSIALYNECKNPLLLTDDTKAREYAIANNLNYSTTLDILIEARELGCIKNNKELHEALDDLDIAKRWMPKEYIDEIKKKYNYNE
jgi:predicted nucleic acid-binding protein